MSRPLDLSGQKFGRLTAVRRGENTKDGHAQWICRCACGKTVIVLARYLKSGHTRSCGCLQAEKASFAASRRNVTHGESAAPLYHVWQSMRARCNNPKHRNFSNYGGRGIKVCEEWDRSYTAFRDWAQRSGYRKGLQLDRLNNNGGYSPLNCRWITPKGNSNNRRTSRYLEYNGERKSVAEWAAEKGISYQTLYSRITDGWTVEKALTVPITGGKSND